MPVKKKGAHLEELLSLLDDQDFLTDSRIFWDDYTCLAMAVGDDGEEWERRAPLFMEAFLDPFIRKWKGAHPASTELLSSPLWQATQSATMAGRWGIIPVYPWTNEEYVTRELKRIQRAISKRKTDFKAIRKAQTAKWLEDCFLSAQMGKAPSRSRLAGLLWGRRKGLTRPSTKNVIGKLSEAREQDLMTRHMKAGKSYQETERLIYRSTRGNEAPAAAIVRMKLQRERVRGASLKKVLTNPNKTDKLGAAITRLLQELPTTPSAPRNLKAICVRALELGNLILPPESAR